MSGTTPQTFLGNLSGPYGPGGLTLGHPASHFPEATSSTDDAIEIVTARLDVQPAEVRVAAALLSDAEQQRAARFAFEHDGRRFIVARARLRELLGERLGVKPAAVQLEYAPNGKPALAPRFAASFLRFNVSHCDDIAAYAFALDRDIGVDVETIRAIPDADEIAARFFARGENEAYLGLDPRDRPLGFFNCWTRKEAFIKALGDGLSYPLDRFEVSLVPGEPARIVRVETTSGDDCGWTLYGFTPAPGMVGAVVVRNVQSSGAGADR